MGVTGSINLRPTSRAGAVMAPMATALARSAMCGNLAQKNRIINGFLLRAVRVGRDYQAQIIDPPSFVLFAGFAAFRGGLATLGYGAVTAGNRDDIIAPGTRAAFDADTASSFQILQVPSVPSDAEPAQLLFFPPTAQLRGLISVGYMATPILRTYVTALFNPLDDMTFFTSAQVVVVGGGFTSIHDSGSALKFEPVVTEGVTPSNYFCRNRYFISELFLVDGWKFHPRRKVSHHEYIGAIDPEYAGRIGPGLLQPGLAALVSDARVGPVVDQICVAARVFKQRSETWYKTDSGPSYRPRFYDRYGYQGLFISIGAYDRRDYIAGTFADFTPISERVITPADLPAVLAPYPASTPPNAWGKPTILGFGQFLIPHAAHAASGFVVFSIYTTYLNKSGTDDPGPSVPSAGDAYAFVVTQQGLAPEAFAIDWDFGAAETLPPGASTDYFAQPWIVGACPLGDGADKRALALVWRHKYGRKTGSPRGIGGHWVLYSAGVGATQEAVLVGPGAPLFAAIMQDDTTQFAQLSFDEDQENTFSMIQDAGGGWLVTAAVDSPTPTITGKINIPSEDIRLAVIDSVAGTIELRGVIGQRSKIYSKCHITVVQRRVPAVGETPAVEPVLMATITDHLIDNRGLGGKVYISVDGGFVWRTYIDGAGAQGGAFFSGNKLWRFDSAANASTGEST